MDSDTQDHHVTMEAEIGVMQPQVEERPGLLGAPESRTESGPPEGTSPVVVLMQAARL